MNKIALINYLNSYLNLDINWWDSSKNWLQVDTTKDEIKKIGYAVDATTYIIDKGIKDNIIIASGSNVGSPSVWDSIQYQTTGIKAISGKVNVENKTLLHCIRFSCCNMLVPNDLRL